jgi:FkbM family methyltransferase
MAPVANAVWICAGVAAAVIVWLQWPGPRSYGPGGADSAFREEDAPVGRTGSTYDADTAFAPAVKEAAAHVSPSAPRTSSAGGFDSTVLYVQPSTIIESEIATKFTKNPTGRLADVAITGVTKGGGGKGGDVRYKMFVHDPKYCKYISKSILEQHLWEGDFASRIINALKAVNGDGWFIDIGANVGYFGMSVAAAGFNVVGIEPALYNTELIAASIAISHVQDKFRLYKSAVSDVPADSLCAMPNEAVGGDALHNQGNFQLRPLEDCKSRGDTYKGSEIVPVQTVDAILQGDPATAGKCFDAMKIDVEGFETKALHGATSVLKGNCPPCFILLEYIAQPSLFELLVDELGYVCKGLGHKRVNGQWKVKPLDAVHPFNALSDQDYQCKLVSDPRCSAVNIDNV